VQTENTVDDVIAAQDLSTGRVVGANAVPSLPPPSPYIPAPRFPDSSWRPQTVATLFSPLLTFALQVCHQNNFRLVPSQLRLICLAPRSLADAVQVPRYDDNPFQKGTIRRDPEYSILASTMKTCMAPVLLHIISGHSDQNCRIVGAATTTGAVSFGNLSTLTWCSI
jgi:hypothetical protein